MYCIAWRARHLPVIVAVSASVPAFCCNAEPALRFPPPDSLSGPGTHSARPAGSTPFHATVRTTIQITVPTRAQSAHFFGPG